MEKLCGEFIKCIIIVVIPAQSQYVSVPKIIFIFRAYN